MEYINCECFDTWSFWLDLVAIIDLYSRKVLSFGLFNTMDGAFWVDSLEDVLRF